MDFFERAKRIVLSVVAMALNATVAIVESMLPFRPEWTERIRVLAAEFAAVEAAATERAGGPPAPRARSAAQGRGEELPTVDQILAAFDVLWQFSQKTKVEGLLLDDEFCARVEKEWSTRTLLHFMRSADTALKEKAEKAQIAARELMLRDRR